MRRFAAVMLVLSAGGLGGLLSFGAAQTPDGAPPPPMPAVTDDAVAAGQPASAGQDRPPTTPGMPPPMMPPTTTPPAEQAPTTAAADSGPALGQAGAAGGLFSGGAPATPTQEQAVQTPAADIVGGAQATGRATTDVGDLLFKSPDATGVEVFHRNPIITDPRVRSYHVGQLVTTADGAYWVPARQDLDTAVSKLDSSMVQDVVVVKGPYSVRYGPGFSFLDIHTYDTPRYDVFENHGVSTTTFKTNGSYILDRQEIYGGDTNWGYRLGYNIDTGNDYETGAHTKIPSSFNSQYVNGAFGFNLSQDSRVEIKAMYVLQQNIELAGMATDIDRLQTNAITVRYVLENQDYFDQNVAEAWYNYTHFRGSSLHAGKWGQIPLFSPDLNVIITDAGMMSTGFREEVSWGRHGDAQCTLGVDLRYLSQRLNEFDNGTVQDGAPPDTMETNFPVPRSHLVNPGIFFDTVLPVTKCFQVKAGVRFDFAQTDIDETPPTVTQATLERDLNTNKFDRDFFLWMAYVTAEYQVCDHWTAIAGFGAAQRPPTLTELYADLPFIAAFQEGSPPTFVRGNPNLKPERLWQGDLGFKTDYEWLRLSVNGFAAWINDYITYDRFSPFSNSPLAITGVNYVNTDLAFLVGGEIYGEVDLSDCLTPFISLSYVEARDETRNDRLVNASGSTAIQEALPSIPPLDTRLGVRLHQPGRRPHWAVEFTARIVENQDLVAASLGEQPTPHFTIFDLRSYWQVADYLTLTAGVENIDNRFYREHLDLRTGLGVYEPGRTYYFGMEWRR